MTIATGEFVSPLIAGLSKLIKSEGYASLEALYEAEEQVILKELANAKDEAELWKLVGRIKMLKKFRHLPEETVDRYLREKNSERGQ